MVRKLMRRMLLVLASLAIAASPASSPAHGAGERIVAVGDLHGDWDAWLAIARAAGLVDARGRWSGGRATLVQMGDIADRGPDSRRIIDHLRRLQREARRAGGRVIVLVGNHEAMNVIGDLRYVHPGEYAAFADRQSERRRDDYFTRNRADIAARLRARTPGLSDAAVRQAFLEATPLGMIEHQLAWHPTGEIGRWVISNPAVVKLGDSLFVHGGLSAEFAGTSIDEINRRVAAALRQRDQSLTSIVSSPLGPLWYRGNVLRGGSASDEIALAAAAEGAAAAARPSIEAELDAVLRAHGARRLVVGHTPALEGIGIAQGGRLVRVDTGISRHYGGRLAFLEITGGAATPRSVVRPAANPGGVR